MLIPPAAVEALLDAGVHVVPAASDRVAFHATAGRHRHSVEAVAVSRRRAVGPRALSRFKPSAPNVRVVLVAPVISDASQQLLDSRGWSWLAVPADGRAVRGAIHFPDGETIRVGVNDAGDLGWLGDQEPVRRRGRTPWGRYAVIRHLLRGRAWSQTDLARRSGVSQPRVSQVLAELEREELVDRVSAGGGRTRWHTSDYQGLMRHWLDTYPGPGGVTTYWYHLDSIREQTALAVEALRRASITVGRDLEPADPVVSGDAAADYLAPYRRSVFGIVYSGVGGDLEAAGFTPAAPRSATLRLIVPEDHSMWPWPGDDGHHRGGDDPGEDVVGALAPGAPYPIADPMQVIWDVAHGPGPDADQAADALKRVVLDDAMHRQARDLG